MSHHTKQPPQRIVINDEDLISMIWQETRVRDLRTAGRTANILIRERLIQLDMIRRDCDPCYEKLVNRHGGVGDVTPAECEPDACPCGQWPGPDEPEADPETGGAG